MPEYHALRLTTEFLDDLVKLSRTDQQRILRALKQLDEAERTPSLRVYALEGQMQGQWSASASKSLRITFLRLEEGQKAIIGCSQHYGD